MVKLLIIFWKSSNIDVWQGPKRNLTVKKYFWKA